MTAADQEQRFKFGRNWSRFLSVLDDSRIQSAEASLREMLGVADLAGRSFIDIGSGSGLFSLAARRLGARVRSFDYDAQSVACTQELRRRYFSDDPEWQVGQGSALDANYLESLGKFDIVYSWGVLHHTGRMWTALGNVAPMVKPGGLLFVSIYNDQGWQSRAWRGVKRLYNVLPGFLRFLVVIPCFVAIQGAILVRDTLRADPLRTWRLYRQRRGMSPWYDLVDWVGGYPFEVARPDEILSFYEQRGFSLQKQRLVGNRMGCNEFVFRRT
jgi:2-polyprenyl-3-methyl-5-hydroxy-6-metoxy-1,4-benzoquinol methylase